MPYNIVADSFHTKKLCSRLSSSEVRFYTENGRFALLSPLGELGGNVRWSSWAHWKVHSGLLISVTRTFFTRCYDWGATSEYRFKIGDFAPTGAGWPKISGRSQKTRLTDLSYGKKPGQIFLPFCHNACVWQTDRQMDGGMDRRTPFSSLVRAGIPCNAKKNWLHIGYWLLC